MDGIDELFLARVKARIEQLETYLAEYDMPADKSGKLQDEIERLRGIVKEYEKPQPLDPQGQA